MPITVESLRVALYDEEAFDKPGKLIIDRRVPGLVAVLMTAKKNIGTNVDAEDCAGLGMSESALFDRAIQNGLNPPPKIAPLWEDEIEGLFLVTGSTFQASAAFLAIDSIPEVFGTHGVIVAYCDKSTLIALRLDSVDEIDLDSLINAYCAVLELESPPQETVFWWRGPGGWDDIRVRVEVEESSVRPGETLRAYLAKHRA